MLFISMPQVEQEMGCQSLPNTKRHDPANFKIMHSLVTSEDVLDNLLVVIGAIGHPHLLNLTVNVYSPAARLCLPLRSSNTENGVPFSLEIAFLYS